MKTIKNLLIAFAALAILAGCQTAPMEPEPVIEYKTRTLLAVIPDHLLPNCRQSSPPEKTKYKEALPTDRESQMTSYIESLHMTITECNNTIDSARDWNSRQKSFFLKRPNDELIETK